MTNSVRISWRILDYDSRIIEGNPCLSGDSRSLRFFLAYRAAESSRFFLAYRAGSSCRFFLAYRAARYVPANPSNGPGSYARFSLAYASGPYAPLNPRYRLAESGGSPCHMRLAESAGSTCHMRESPKVQVRPWGAQNGSLSHGRVARDFVSRFCGRAAGLTTRTNADAGNARRTRTAFAARSAAYPSSMTRHY